MHANTTRFFVASFWFVVGAALLAPVTKAAAATGNGAGNNEATPEATKDTGAAPRDPTPPPAPLFALPIGDLTLSLAPYAQYRPRAEFIGDRALTSEAIATVVTHRARLGLVARTGSIMHLRIEMQDVRAFGAELAPPSEPPDPTVFGRVEGSIDMHQAYLALTFTPLVEVRIGRQEINVDNQRIVGALDWAQRARTFDGVRVLGAKDDTLAYSFAAFTISDRDVNPTLGDAWLAIAALDVLVIPKHKLHMAAFYDAQLSTPRQRATAGGRFAGGIAGFDYEIETYAQGSRKDDGIRYAALAGLRFGYTLDVLLHPSAGFVVDVLSGAPGGVDAPGLTTFDPFYGLNHAFYGYQDLFTNLPLHTKNQGLVDVAARVGLSEGPFSARAFVHVFAPTSSTAALPLYGVEPDLVVGYAPFRGLRVEGGASLFVPVGDALGRGTRMAPWAYAQLAGDIGS
jgi:hypothetical protein